MLNLMTQGDGPTVVLIHGIGTTMADWALSGQTALLSKHHRVIAMDRPGYGQSAREAGPCTPADQADAIAATLSEAGIQRATLVGHSYGVLPAIHCAARHPNRIAALVLIGGVFYADFLSLRAAQLLPRPSQGLLRRAGPPLARTTTPLFIRLSFWPASVPNAFRDDFPYGDVSRPSQLEAQIDDVDAIADAVRGIPETLANLMIPVTLIAGTKDTVLLHRQHSQRLAGAVPNVRLSTIQDAGHMVHHTHTARVAGLIAGTVASAA